MPFTIFTLAMLLICVFCIGKEIFNGFLRGPIRALVSLCVVVLSIICSIFVLRVISGVLSEIIVKTIVDEFINSNIPMLADFSVVHKIASFLIQVLLAGFLFLLIFPLLRLGCDAIISLVFKLNSKKTGDVPYAQSSLDKFLGALVGCLCGMITTIVVTAPIMGTVHILSDTINLVEHIRDNLPEDQELAIPEFEPMDKYAEDAIGDFCYTIGGEKFYKSITVGKFEGKSLSLVEELEHIKNTAEFAVEIVSAFYVENESFDFSQNANGLYKSFEESEILKSASLEMVSEFSLAWMNGEPFLSAQIPDFNDDFKPMVSELLVVGSGINEYNVMPTLKTLLNVVGVLIECDITVDSKTAEVDYYLLAPKLCKALEDNPEMKNARLKLENAAVIAISDWVNANFSSNERKTMTTSIANDVAQIFIDITEPEARLEAINQKLLVQFADLGLPIDASFSELFANRLVKITEDNYGQISSQDIEKLLDQHRGGLTN